MLTINRRIGVLDLKKSYRTLPKK